MNPHYYNPPSPWVGREDTRQGRLFQQTQLLDLQNLPAILPEGSIVLLGFSCDEGVRRNLGRFGAAGGPWQLRKALQNIPWDPKKSVSLWDAGTICCPDDELEMTQQLLGETVAALQERGAFVLVLGGGHEVAWGNFQGLVKTCVKSMTDEISGIDVVNFDAHFDLRPLFPDGKGSSGTCFRQMHDYCQEEKISWRYACLGIQRFGNTSELFDYAASINAFHSLAEEMVAHPHLVHESLGVWLASAKKIHLTLCLDVFAAAFAPGVSAPQSLGLAPQTVLPFFRQVLESGKVIGFDIAELNPLYDRDDQTASLAAYFVAEVLQHLPFLKNHVG